MSQNLRPSHDPEALEVAPGTRHENREGWVPTLAGEQELRAALDEAFDYRGDVTLALKDGRKIEGYVFDRRPGADLASSRIRVMPAGSSQKLSISYSEIADLVFSGRDTAAGRSWEAWVRKYWEKRQAGEHNIGIEPEKLD
jgi:hypothetical protein